MLAAAIRLRFEGVTRLYGYDLFATLKQWEGGPPMNHGTLYRCLRSLESRGMFTSTVDQSVERLKVWYELTDEGIAAARKATLRLAAEDEPPRWVDVSVAIDALPPAP